MMLECQLVSVLVERLGEVLVLGWECQLALVLVGG